MPQSSVDSLYKDNQPWLFNWLVKKLGCQHRAEDLTHDTFVRLLQTQHKQTEFSIEQPKAYLRTVANGLVVDYFRKKSLEQAYQQALNEIPELTQLSEETLYLLKETLEQLDRLIDRLPKRVKSVFLYSQLDGLTYAAIAEKLGISLRTVKRDMQQAYIHCLTLSWFEDSE